MTKNNLILILVFISSLLLAQPNIKKIETLMSENRITEALPLIDKALLEDATNSKLLLYKGMIIQEQIEISTTSDNKKLILDSTYYFYSSSLKYDEQNILTSVLADNLLSVAKQYSYTGMEHFNEGEYKLALEDFENNLEISELSIINQLDTIVWYNIAITSSKLKEYKKAELYYNKIIQFNPKDWNAIVSLATLYKEQGDLNRYYSIISKANKKYPEVINFYNELIAYYLESSKNDSALIFLDELLINDSQNDKLHYLKGSILQEQGKTKESNIQYKKSLQINPNNVDAAFNYAANNYNLAIDLLLKNKKSTDEKELIRHYLEESLIYLDIVKKFEPNNKSVLKMLLICYQELGMPQEEAQLKEYIQNIK